MSPYKLLKPKGRRKKWRVDGPEGYWTCDSEAIAREVLSRLRMGRSPGWAARDLRMGMDR